MRSPKRFNMKATIDLGEVAVDPDTSMTIRLYDYTKPGLAIRRKAEMGTTAGDGESVKIKME